MIQELEPRLKKIQKDIEKVRSSQKAADQLILKQLTNTYQNLLQSCYKNLSASDRVYLARHPQRPNANQYINYLIRDFIELKGDRLSGDDKSIIAGVGFFHEIAVTILAHKKGHSLEENLACNFGMSSPSGYRKVQRLVKQAEKFGRPILTFIDTPGAYPGIEAEKQGQGEAIASCLAMFSDIKVPVIAVIIGEGGSGGALAIGVADKIVMLENAVYSILSPEGFATILWKDVKRKDEACEIMKLTSYDLKELGVIDEIIPEGVGSAIVNEAEVMLKLEKSLEMYLEELQKIDTETLIQTRYEKFRVMGEVID